MKEEKIISRNDENEVNIELPVSNGGIIRLKLISKSDCILPKFTGNIARASLLRYLSDLDEELVETLHKANHIRPYSIKQLALHKNSASEIRKDLLINTNDILFFEIGVLDKKILEETVNLFVKNSSKLLKFCESDFAIVSVEYSQHNPPPKNHSKKVKIYFRSPTYFTVKAKPEPMLFPDPKYFFMNLTKIWNTMNPEIVIPEEQIYEWIDKNVVINDYATYTRRVHISKSRPINGFMGWVVYRFKEKKEYFPWMNVLLEYAKISNVGGNRTGGMGEIDFRWLEEQK